MLKKTTLAALVMGMALASFPADARPIQKKNITFSAPVACTFACPYWVHPASASSVGVPAAPNTDVDPTSDDPVDLAFDSGDYAIDIADSLLGATLDARRACTDPGPAGAYDDVRVKVPRKGTLLVFEAWPVSDWDLFVCAAPRKGQVGSRHIATGANSAGNVNTGGDDLCSQTQDTLGCYEKIQIKVRGGRSYILRAYNWADPSELRARYRIY